jgi:hypothetical protein
MYEGGLPSSWSFGDITFTNDKAPEANLTEEEKYMIAGAESSSLREGVLLPWETMVFVAVDRFYDKYGFVPTQLTSDVLKVIPGMEHTSDAALEEYRNPLTDAWPRLDAVVASPGDIFVKRLTSEEMKHYAGLADTLKSDWYGTRTFPGTDKAPMRLTSGVYYFRMYGWHGVICENFQYRIGSIQ